MLEVNWAYTFQIAVYWSNFESFTGFLTRNCKQKETVDKGIPSILIVEVKVKWHVFVHIFLLMIARVFMAAACLQNWVTLQLGSQRVQMAPWAGCTPTDSSSMQTRRNSSDMQQLGSAFIPPSSFVRDLGVYIDADLYMQTRVQRTAVVRCLPLFDWFVAFVGHCRLLHHSRSSCRLFRVDLITVMRHWQASQCSCGAACNLFWMPRSGQTLVCHARCTSAHRSLV